MNDLIINKVGANHITLIQELTMQVWPQTYAPLLTDEQIVFMLDQMYSAAALRSQIQSGHQFIIAWFNQQPIGFASYSRTEVPNEFKLNKLYVIESTQKKGAGKSLLWFVIDEVKKMGGQYLILQVNRHNKNAISFYMKMGFQFELEADFDIGNGFYMNDYVMGLQL